MSLSPIKWFTNGKLKLLAKNKGKIDRELLQLFGWKGCYLWGVEYDIPPRTAGIYVYSHEWEKEFLYVGQTTNIRNRAFNKSHHKLSWIIKKFEDFPFAYYDQSNVDRDIYVYYKEVKEQYFNNSLKRSLIWCEALTIGLLKPEFQDDISDIYDFSTRTGVLRFEDNEDEDEQNE
jgi:hypothetical protein